MSLILLDSSVLIDIWRKGDSHWPEIQHTFSSINTVCFIEFLQGANHRQKNKALAFLDRYNHIRLDRPMCDLAVDLINKHSHTEGLRLADALVAATAMVLDIELLTLNRRHFEKISNLKLI